MLTPDQAEHRLKEAQKAVRNFPVTSASMLLYDQRISQLTNAQHAYNEAIAQHEH